MLNFLGNITKRIETLVGLRALEESCSLDEERLIMKSKNQQYLLKMLSLVESNDGFSGAVKLVKAIFLIQYEGLKNNNQNYTFDYKFYRWDYGPFDSSIYSDLSSLKNQGLIEIIESDHGSFSEKKYKITDQGKNKLQELFTTADQNTDSIFKNIVNQVNKSSRSEILKKVYDLADVYSYEMGDVIRMKKSLQQT